MGVYINGMEMPTEGTVITIYKMSGKFYACVHGTELYPLVPVPPHGDLIDKDAYEYPGDLMYEPVIIPASEEDET